MRRTGEGAKEQVEQNSPRTAPELPQNCNRTAPEQHREGRTAQSTRTPRSAEWEGTGICRHGGTCRVRGATSYCSCRCRRRRTATKYKMQSTLHEVLRTEYGVQSGVLTLNRKLYLGMSRVASMPLIPHACVREGAVCSRARIRPGPPVRRCLQLQGYCSRGSVGCDRVICSKLPVSSLV